MRRLVVAENITANGVIEFVENWFDPAMQDDEALLAAAKEHMAAEETLLLGRETFEDFRGYWPHQTDDDSGSTQHLNSVQKVVVSRTMTDPEWENSTVLQGDLVEAVRELKQGDGGEIGITGSISVVHELIRADLVDEYRLFVYPVITSRGRSLVPDGVDLRQLGQAEATTFASGVTLMTYRTG